MGYTQGSSVCSGMIHPIKPLQKSRGIELAATNHRSVGDALDEPSTELTDRRNVSLLTWT